MSATRSPAEPSSCKRGESARRCMFPLPARGERAAAAQRWTGEGQQATRRCRWCFSLIASLLLLLAAGPARAALQETPFFAKEVAAGKLPPVLQRIPQEPSLAELETLGKPGGDLRMLMASPKDTRLMVVYGYARLVDYTPGLAIVPDILLGVDVQEGRIFTMHLRPGHKWSDGKPFTCEGFRYWFEDVAQNHELTLHFARALWKNGWLELRTTKQAYSATDGRFLPDRYVIGTCPHCGYDRARGDQCENCTRVLDPVDLIDPRSAVSGARDIEINAAGLEQAFLELTGDGAPGDGAGAGDAPGLPRAAAGGSAPIGGPA